jgi:recombination protein RecA
MATRQRENSQEARTALQKELERVEADFGKGTVVSSALRRERVDVISTGSLSLDRATGIGGLPRGKVVEIRGWESCGKSTITLQTIANAQKLGLSCLLVDGEESFDLKYARQLGIDTDKLLIMQLDEHGGEGCYDVAERLIRTREVGIVVFDSQTSLLPKKALNGVAGESNIGLHARLMSQTVPKIVNAAAYGNTLVIYISQFREKVGFIYGDPTTTNGGHALKFYAHMRIDVSKSVLRDEAKEAYANKTTCKVIKNKLAPPFKEATFRINFGTGVDRMLELVDLGEELGIITLRGSWYSMGETRLGQGADNVTQLLADNEELAKDIERRIKDKINEEDTIEEDLQPQEGEVRE